MVGWGGGFSKGLINVQLKEERAHRGTQVVLNVA